ncbi:recombinase family protein [Xanthomonas oryzae]|uniref:recombinase family protein n=2 Tax=Xanthomonas oryzae TaxID=347 RepID=UPI003CCEA1C3
MQEIEPPPHPPGSGPVFRAAQYVRMSTEHQQYWTENQGDKIREYAARRNIEIVRTYADEGKSGLRIDGRQALQQLIADVQAGTTNFPDHPRLRREPLGSLPGRGRKRLLRVHLPPRRDSGRLLRRAVRERWLARVDHRQGRQARDGG